ncbi:hypothetical protein CDAR_195581 [Caerostris darwini]|uniref:Uncharacterized protein n=1 Tax=Caerostris darwini TaxID=1538125 RepID=A0AAV4NBJ1_9ARAC|nr:hypothetical protein CDAR_195581 [Caerostris darwini]
MELEQIKANASSVSREAYRHSVQHLQHLPSDSLDSILSSETPREKFILGELSLQLLKLEIPAQQTEVSLQFNNLFKHCCDNILSKST